MFIDKEAVRMLTGYAQGRKQAEQLKRMGIPFFLNAAGRPVVAESFFSTGKSSEPSSKGWKSAVLEK